MAADATPGVKIQHGILPQESETMSDQAQLDRLCIRAYEQLKSEGIKARVISMPSWELFESQSQEYRDSVILTEIAARVAVEEASTFGWERYTGLQGTVLGMHTFGLSAPMKVVAQHFGFELEHVVVAAKEQIARHASKNGARHPNSGMSGEEGA